VLRQKDRRWIGHAFQPTFGHREDPKLVRGTEAVLDRANKAKARMRITFEIKDRVDDMLEHARTGDRAFLRHVTDEEHDHAALLGEPRQLGGTFADLRDAARGRGEHVGVRGLDRIDNDELRLRRIDCGDNRFELHFGEQLDRRIDEAKSLRA
jgi:hypothetical protein